MRERRPLPQALLDRAFDTATAKRIGVTRTQLGGDEFEAPHHGVRVPVHTSGTVAGRARGLLPVLGQHRHFSSVTALAIWGAPLPQRLGTGAPLHVTSIRPVVRMRRPGVVGHTSGPAPIVSHDGVPVEPAHRAWLHAARELSLQELVIAGDALVGRATGSVSDVGALSAAVAEGRGLRGTARARDALQLIRVGAESPKETEVRLVLPPHLLASVELNVDVLDRGTFIGRPDLLFVDAMITIEYEGDQHRTDRKTFRNDIARRRAFEDAGWRVIQITQDDLSLRPGALRSRLTAIIESRAGSGGHLTCEWRGSRLVEVRS